MPERLEFVYSVKQVARAPSLGECVGVLFSEE